MARLQRIAAIATIALSSCGPHVAGPRAGASGLQSNACNDGNALNGDGCSAAHEVEPGWSCTSGPSACVATHPSCAGLPDTCAGTSCCASHVVPGGNFV